MVVARKSTLGNWTNEIKRFCPMLRAVKFLGNPEERNNLHELWSLLNFLLPEIFSSAETFDEWFQISGENDQQEFVVFYIDSFFLFVSSYSSFSGHLRLKSDVENGLPPKKETILKVAVNKDELLQMVRFGAEMVFSFKYSTITDEDIDRIIAKGEEAAAEIDAKMKKFTGDAIKFKMDNCM
ncbi:hypothetical protein FNV43_RR20828 [Rhamnella rubrinervis]|uniref:SNF2 N-terminal domain-containing protein n=1 Tax=Rhamnella rubrinervis TaxID=2594499 RepID=A0A8K0GQU7_9ROSA|nr:hypothetical protein FNV43_RR20828 [Rhamnella rubrinervis]